MEWGRGDCLRLIDVYKKYPQLWDPKHENYYYNLKKSEAWEAVDKAMGCPPGEAKRKMEILLASFRREKGKGRRSGGIRKGRREIYASKWYAFTRMSFLLNRNESPQTKLNPDPIKEEVILIEDFEEAVKGEAVTECVITPQPLAAAETALASTRIPSHNPQIYKERSPGKEEDSQAKVACNSLRNHECGVYAQHVAHKLRSYSKKTRNIVQHHINLILFNADMGQYDQQLEYNRPSTLSTGLTVPPNSEVLVAPVVLSSSSEEEQFATSVVSSSHETC